MDFSIKTMDLFQSRQYRGIDPNADAVGLSGSLGSGRYALISIRCDDQQRILEARHRTMNCVPAVAAAEWVCEWVRGRSIAEAAALKVETLLSELEDIPLSRKFCAQLVRDALLAAISNLVRKGPSHD